MGTRIEDGEDVHIVSFSRLLFKITFIKLQIR